MAFVSHLFAAHSSHSAAQDERRNGKPGVFLGGRHYYYEGYLIISLHLGVLARGALHCIAVHCTLLHTRVVARGIALRMRLFYFSELRWLVHSMDR